MFDILKTRGATAIIENMYTLDLDLIKVWRRPPIPWISSGRLTCPANQRSRFLKLFKKGSFTIRHLWLFRSLLHEVSGIIDRDLGQTHGLRAGLVSLAFLFDSIMEH